MTRTEFKTIIKIFSAWRIDKRKGNYSLPGGGCLSHYLRRLTAELCERNHIAIKTNGDIGETLNGRIFVPFGDDEFLNEQEQEQRIRAIVDELIY